MPSQTACLTFFYTAPEILLLFGEEEEGDKYNSKSDIWSLACTLIEMVSGKRPWLTRLPEQKNTLYTFKKLETIFVKDPSAHPAVPSILSHEGQKFIKSMLCRDHQHRPRASELLKEPYLNQGERQRLRHEALHLISIQLDPAFVSRGEESAHDILRRIYLERDQWHQS